MANFTDINLLDSFSERALDAMACVQINNFTGPVWLGETSSTYDGGTEGLSDSFVAGFMYVSINIFFFLASFVCVQVYGTY